MVNPTYLLKRHPVAMRATFAYSLVLSYAYPQAMLEPLLPPGLEIDAFDGLGFVAIALVRAERMGPAFLPRAIGLDFMLAGFRIFARYRTTGGRTLRGLRILRSETDSPLMASVGNLLTHYRYRRSRWTVSRSETRLDIALQSADGTADLDVSADVGPAPAPLPAHSPFPDLKTARRFAGPLPYTFDYEAETNSIVRIEGVRTHWDPLPVTVDVRRNTFLERPEFADAEPRLANAFLVRDIPYLWRRGVREPLPTVR